MVISHYRWEYVNVVCGKKPELSYTARNVMVTVDDGACHLRYDGNQSMSELRTYAMAKVIRMTPFEADIEAKYFSSRYNEKTNLYDDVTIPVRIICKF